MSERGIQACKHIIEVLDSGHWRDHLGDRPLAPLMSGPTGSTQLQQEFCFSFWGAFLLHWMRNETCLHFSFSLILIFSLVVTKLSQRGTRTPSRVLKSDFEKRFLSVCDSSYASLWNRRRRWYHIWVEAQMCTLESCPAVISMLTLFIGGEGHVSNKAV